MIDSVDFWSIPRYPILRKRQIRDSEPHQGPLQGEEEAEKFRLFSLDVPTVGVFMKGNRVCIMAWAQEIDHSISSASYHVAMHLPAFVFTGAYPERGN